MRATIVLIFLLFISNLIYPQHNDAKEYGFKGNIEKTITKTYKNLEKIADNQWKIDSSKLIATDERFFDENNNIKKGNIKSYSKDKIHEFKYLFEGEGNQRKRYLYDNKENILSMGKYHWIDQLNFIYINESSTLLSKFNTTLNKEFRDYISENFYYKINEDSTQTLIEHTKYISDFDNSGVRYIETYLNGKVEHSTLNLIVIKQDKHRNHIEYAYLNNNLTLDSYVVREFFYRE